MIQRPWSCDTFVASADATRSGATIFGKNSDRPAGEAQPLRHSPACVAGAPLQLAYVTIADADAYAHVGSAPFWCWATRLESMSIEWLFGNEAVFTRTVGDGSRRRGRWAWAITRPVGHGTRARLGLERGARPRASADGDDPAARTVRAMGFGDRGEGSRTGRLRQRISDRGPDRGLDPGDGRVGLGGPARTRWFMRAISNESRSAPTLI